MALSKKSVLEKIDAFLSKWLRDKKTGQITVEVNMSQGGIGEMEIKTKEKVK